MSAVERPPFDALDAATAEAYLRDRGTSSFDPFAAPLAHEDLIFTTSLSYQSSELLTPMDSGPCF